MIRVQNCLAGAPVVMSAPHFLKGDQVLVDAIEGLHPEPDLHDTILLIEPLTGVAMSGHKKIQVWKLSSLSFSQVALDST